ncbi:MAG: glycoside hydrolase family 3 C-terminal domain-containing protein [Actinomycetia bacterium]|nr:glycoside hydrolase family 3 C-terminal domain-containing protein [Actinomycetes bacterium]
MTSEKEPRALELLEQLTPAERLRLLSGDQELYRDLLGMAVRGSTPPLYSAAAVPRLGLAGLYFVDGPRGVARGVSTCFPVPMARAASFDYALEERIGEAIGREARAHGANICLAPCLNLLRHPGWGRAQETYGEDSKHIGEMGAAFVRGLQRHVLGCAKHFACNSIEESRFKVDVRVSPEVLDRIYLPHFKRVVEEGVACVMSAYNSLNGEWCGQNRSLLTSTLKERWGFTGFVVSDWVFGIRDGVAAINAGLDLEMPCRLFVDERVRRAVELGVVPQARIDDAALRLIRAQLRFAAIEDGHDEDYGPAVIACCAHRALAREAATKGIVLLRNEAVTVTDGSRRPALPLEPREVNSVAVIGRLAAVPNTGDHGSSNVTAPYVVTPLEGLRAALQPLGIEVVHDDGSRPQRAAALAAGVDAAIVIAGYDYRDEGEYLGEFPPPGFEKLLPRPPFQLVPRVLAAAARVRRGGRVMPGGGDRRSLTLHDDEERLIQAVAAANARTVVVLMCGSAVLMEGWRHSVPGILILWYPGMEGGHALADVVLGRAKPTGRLPFVIPTSPDHLPPFDPAADTVEYDELHGQALLDHLGVPAAYPYGFGLTYKD